jgi:hypothetical protein
VQIGAAVRPAGGSAIRRFSGENNRMTWQIGTSAAGDPGTDPDPAFAEDIPEPGSVSLFCLGLLGLALYGWHTRKRLVYDRHSGSRSSPRQTHPDELLKERPANRPTVVAGAACRRDSGVT